MTSNEKMPEFSSVGLGTKFVGEITHSGDFSINGDMKGIIKVGGDVCIGENANVQAQIQAQSATVNGKLFGSLAVENKLVFSEKAAFEGTMVAKKLKVDEGAVINGKIVMTRET